MKKANSIILLLLFTFIVFFSCKRTTETKSTVKVVDGIEYKVEVFEVDTGWGYQILKNDDVYIYQDLIPAVNGHFLFETAEDALVTGDFVLQRALKYEGLPSVTISELDSLGVLNQEVLDYQDIDFGTKTGILPKK
ncbi:MAG: DUF4907 domain-containing protein [Bacteroidales bacterium]|nr:DUF4907 domain-containing protein [Bacteroidales bacterium]